MTFFKATVHAKSGMREYPHLMGYEVDRLRAMHPESRIDVEMVVE